MLRRSGTAWLIVIVLGVVTFGLLVVFLTGLTNNATVVVAKVALQAGTRLESGHLQTRSINANAALPGHFSDPEELVGQVLTVQRMPDDQITAAMVGDEALSAIAATLPADQAAVAVNIDQATGLAGTIRVGDRVGVVGILDVEQAGLGELFEKEPQAPAETMIPSQGGQEGEEGEEEGVVETPRNPSSLARVVLTDLKVLVVPYTFRYEEVNPAGSEDAVFSLARTTSRQQEESVVVLAVPIAPVEVMEGVWMSPLEVMVLLNAKGTIHLFLESLHPEIPHTAGVQADDLLEAMMGLPVTATVTVMASPGPQEPLSPLSPTVPPATATPEEG
jgi:Flp pilus assembly protein CpaB